MLIGTPVIASTALTNSGPFEASRGAAVARTCISLTPSWLVIALKRRIEASAEAIASGSSLPLASMPRARPQSSFSLKSGVAERDSRS